MLSLKQRKLNKMYNALVDVGISISLYGVKLSSKRMIKFNNRKSCPYIFTSQIINNRNK